tara:strand:- start:68 stop:211 length:144 start_codon:yes stop_codon:yes gene_type:complete
MILIGGENNMGEGYYGVSDEFIMFVFVPALMLVLGYIFFPSVDDKHR